MNNQSAYRFSRPGLTESPSRETIKDMSMFMNADLIHTKDMLLRHEFMPQPQQPFLLPLQAPLAPQVAIDPLRSLVDSPWIMQQSPVSSSPGWSSSNSGTGSSHSSPATETAQMMNLLELEELEGLFDVQIEDFLAQNAPTFLCAPNMDFNIFATLAQAQSMEDLSSFCIDSMDYQQPQQDQQQHSPRHGHCALSEQTHHQEQAYTFVSPSSSSSPCLSPKPYQRNPSLLAPRSPVTKSTAPYSSPSPVTIVIAVTPQALRMSPSVISTILEDSTTAEDASSSAAVTTAISKALRNKSTTTATTTTATTTLSNTEGMIVIKNEDGFMVYNPETELISFRCVLCPYESFGRIHDLKRHHASKHREMTWPCEFCHRLFARRDALLRHYTSKSTKIDGIHPASDEKERLLAARARSKLIG